MIVTSVRFHTKLLLINSQSFQRKTAQPENISVWWNKYICIYFVKSIFYTNFAAKFENKVIRIKWEK